MINAYRDLISQKSIDRYSRVLTKAIDIDTEHALNAYKIIHGLLSSGVWCENILLIFNYVNKDTFRTVYILSLGFEKDICSSVLILIENLPQKIVTLERKNLCRVLVEIFLTCDSDENRSIPVIQK